MSPWKLPSLALLLAALTLGAQTPIPPEEPKPQDRAAVTPMAAMTASPNMVQGSTKALNYRFLKSSTKIDIKGTALAPTAQGLAKIANDASGSRIKVRFEGMPEPNQVGPEYLTYVLWAVSPEGRPHNLGELALKKGKAQMKVTEPMPAFGLMVTAEPYFAVNQPSEAVVMENALRPDTDSQVQAMEAKLDLLKRGQYHLDAPADPAAPMDSKTPLAVYQARNAVAIAKAAGAGSYAGEPFGKAQELLAQAENKEGRQKDRIIAAREAIQGAEDARLMAVKHQEAEILENERKQAQARIDQAKQETEQAAKALADANQSRTATLNENEELKGKLLGQLNAILQTRATARGLIVNMSGVVFQTGKATLLPSAREKLAKVAGLILAHPGLKVESEGYTDSTGSDEVNLKLSEQRAQAARDFLVAQGVSPDAIVSRGLGKASPIASNDNPQGRQTNRRVELVVSGAGITGTPALAN